jgi:hypothetical protein
VCSNALHTPASQRDTAGDQLKRIAGPALAHAHDEDVAMKWTPGSGSSIDDQRGRSGVMRAALPIGLGGVLILLVGSWLTGTDLFANR